MGPECFHPGNTGTLYLYVDAAGLQWGRNVSIPEMLQGDQLEQRSILLQWGRDVSIPEMKRNAGNAEPVCMLQWGRDVSIPEITLASPGGFSVTMLQWGRDVSIPEICGTRELSRPARRFNGAGMFLSRKYRRRPLRAIR